LKKRKVGNKIKKRDEKVNSKRFCKLVNI
jgi:hypothetical protein